jgi:hypothetical protein
MASTSRPVSIRMMLLAEGEVPKVPTHPDEFGTWGLLSVRPRNPTDVSKSFDVSAIRETDLVFPPGSPTLAHAEGLSCSQAPVDVYCQRFRLPRKKERVWEIDASQLPDGLVVISDAQPDDPDHMLIVPTRPMTLTEFQTLLASTRPFWRMVQYP